MGINDDACVHRDSEAEEVSGSLQRQGGPLAGAGSMGPAGPTTPPGQATSSKPVLFRDCTPPLDQDFPKPVIS